MAFTPLKDVNLMILENLNDRDILNYCQTNREARKLCNDENFWRRRTLQNFRNIKIPYEMSWRKYYLFRLSHEIIVLEYPGIKTEVVIDKNSEYMLKLLKRLKDFVKDNYPQFKLKNDDEILSLIAREVAVKFHPEQGEEDDEDDNLEDITFCDIIEICRDDTVFDLTEEDITNFWRCRQEQMFSQFRGSPPFGSFESPQRQGSPP